MTVSPIGMRLTCPRCEKHPETEVQRELFDVGYIPDWLEPVPDLALTCRVIVARQTASQRAEAVTSGKLVGSFVYDLFLATAPAQCLRANEIVEL